MNNRQRKKEKVKKQQVQRSQSKSHQNVKKNKRIVITAGTLSVVIAALAIILQFFDLKHPLRGKPNVRIETEFMNVEELKEIGDRASRDIKVLPADSKLNVSYLENSSDQITNSTYPLFEDSLNTTQENVFRGDCATQIYISNNYDEEILLKNIIFEAEDINVNTEPVVVLGVLNFSAPFTQATLGIANSGWEDIENLTLKFDDPNGDINEYLKPEKQSYDIPVLKYGEYIDINLWQPSDFLLDGTYTIDVSCWNEDKQIEFDDPGESIHLHVTVKDGIFVYDGMGAPSESIYGVIIDTSKNRFTESRLITEPIAGNSRLELPICFSADKSCEFKFRIGFVLLKKNNIEEKIWSEYSNVNLKISSLGSYVEDASEYTMEELQETMDMAPGFITVSYPYADKDALKYVEPKMGKR